MGQVRLMLLRKAVFLVGKEEKIFLYEGQNALFDSTTVCRESDLLLFEGQKGK